MVHVASYYVLHNNVMLRLVHISDTHNRHEELNLPDGDIIVHSGDFTRDGTQAETEKFMAWWDRLRHPYKVLVAGNHDKCFDIVKYNGTRPFWFSHMMAKYLKNDAINFYLEHGVAGIWGLRIFGSPYSKNAIPGDNRWAFTYEEKDASAIWVDIPEDLDILITHAPPQGKLDWCNAHASLPTGHGGCHALRYFVKQRKPKLHLFGHIHEDYGVEWDADTIYSNSSAIDPYSKTVNEPIVFEINENTKEITVLEDKPF